MSALQSPDESKWILIQVIVILVGQSTFLAVEIIKLTASNLGAVDSVLGGASKRSGQLRVHSLDLTHPMAIKLLADKSKTVEFWDVWVAKELLFILKTLNHPLPLRISKVLPPEHRASWS